MSRPTHHSVRATREADLCALVRQVDRDDDRDADGDPQDHQRRVQWAPDQIPQPRQQQSTHRKPSA